MRAGGQLIVTCYRRHDANVTVTSPCLMVDYVTDVIRPCPHDLTTLSYLRVTSDNKYLVGVERRKRRVAVFTVDKQGTTIHRVLVYDPAVTARHSNSGRQPNCGVEQRAPPVVGRAAITVGIGAHL